MSSRDSARDENFLSALHALREQVRPVGCVCPPTSEQTCQAPLCPRLPPARQEFQDGKLVWVRDISR